MTELLMLDVRTMAFASAVSGFLMAATMGGIYLAGMRSRAVLDWMAAGLALGFGYLIGHILQSVEVPVPAWVAGTVANATIGVGLGLILVGVQRYLGMRCWTIPVLVTFGVILVMLLLIPEARETLRSRIIMFSGPYILVVVLAGLLLWKADRPGMCLFHRVAAMVLLLYAAFLLLRFGYAIFSPALTTSFVQDPFQMTLFLTSMVFGFFITMALLVMMFREKQVELHNLASKDPLTGINNRLGLDRAADRHMEAAREHGTPLSVVLLDIDHFKQINDRHGHQAGDTVLNAMARRIEAVLRNSDNAFRVGGEEFLVLLPGAGLGQARGVAERLRQSIAAEPMAVDDRALWLTASFGVVECRVDEESWAACLQRVDRALYRAKDAGRDRVEVSGQVTVATP
jgi:diguanylate cyclase (GGDEF)-like protein